MVTPHFRVVPGLRSVITAGVVAVLIVTAVVVDQSSQAPVKHTAAATSTGGDGYCAELADAIGLYPGNPVTQMGVKVGTVSKITDAGDHVRVVFSLDPGRAYPANVKAVTRSKSLLADRSLELVGNYQSGEILKPDTCIARSRTHTPKSISEIAGSASDFIKTLTKSGSGDLNESIDGLDKALAGTGTSANTMLRHAAAAAGNPDQFVADIGSSIANMAPLTDDALTNWPQIMSILNQMPAVAAGGIDLFGPVGDFCRGVGWVVATLYDIQRNYGDQILWPLMKGPVKDIIALAAARAPDLQKLYEMVPSIAAGMRAQTNATGGLSVPYKSPVVKGADGRSADLLSMIAQKAGTR